MAVQNSRSNETFAGSNLFNYVSCIFVNCTAESTNDKGGYYLLRFLHINSFSQALQFCQHIIVSSNNSFTYKTHTVIRGWLAVIVCSSARNCASLRPNLLPYIRKSREFITSPKKAEGKTVFLRNFKIGIIFTEVVFCRTRRLAGRSRYSTLPFLYNHTPVEHLDIAGLSFGESNPDIGVFEDNPVFCFTDIKFCSGIYSCHSGELAYLDSGTYRKAGYVTNTDRSYSGHAGHFLLRYNYFYRLCIFSAASYG